MAYCLHYATITKHSNLNLIDRLQSPLLTASTLIGQHRHRDRIYPTSVEIQLSATAAPVKRSKCVNGPWRLVQICVLRSGFLTGFSNCWDLCCTQIVKWSSPQQIRQVSTRLPIGKILLLEPEAWTLGYTYHIRFLKVCAIPEEKIFSQWINSKIQQPCCY